ncbi:MAG: AgmX/PglI C-terminal domain-containing protein [Archangium sp.]|nr:AgmX/PglI C-terminal domain-containing protein [Archangium sp.]
MTATTPALRIALIHGGRIIEDRTLDAGKRSTITVGADPKSTFCVPMGELPKSVSLFKVTKEGAQLMSDGSLEGRVSLGGPEQSLAEVPANVMLMKGSKGRVKVGDVTVLFQMVTPPPAVPLPTLPKGAKGVVAQLDRAFVVAMAFSFFAHLVGAGYVMAQPTPVEPDLSLADWQQQDRFAATLMPIPKQVPEQSPAKTKEPIADAPKKEPEQAKAPVAQAPAKSKTTTASADAVKARISKMGMLAVIGSVGGEGGVVGDLLKDSNGVGGVADAMKNAGVQVATAEDALKLKLKGSETGATVGVTAMGTDGVKNVVLEESKTVAIAGRVREEVITVDAPDISSEALSNWMRGRRGAIVSCYERELKRDHSLSGRLVLKFVVSTRGRVTDLDLSEGTMQNAAVRECITSIARNWVLPFTPEDEVPVAFPFVFSPVN